MKKKTLETLPVVELLACRCVCLFPSEIERSKQQMAVNSFLFSSAGRAQIE
jgi:hypothetical protein